jgi:hypothetical protein
MKRAWQLSQWISSVRSRLGERENGRTFPRSDPLRLGIPLAPSIADSRSSGCSLNGDNLGRFNIIGLAAELAQIRTQEAGITMKICHVAALVLAGWCLMMPPFVQGKHGVVDWAAPLSKWTVTNAFDTAAECENFRGTAMKFDQKRSAQDPTNQSYKVVHTQRAISQCIAIDDPRLSTTIQPISPH